MTPLNLKKRQIPSAAPVKAAPTVVETPAEEETTPTVVETAEEETTPTVVEAAAEETTAEAPVEAAPAPQPKAVVLKEAPAPKPAPQKPGFKQVAVKTTTPKVLAGEGESLTKDQRQHEFHQFLMENEVLAKYFNFENMSLASAIALDSEIEKFLKERICKHSSLNYAGMKISHAKKKPSFREPVAGEISCTGEYTVAKGEMLVGEKPLRRLGMFIDGVFTCGVRTINEDKSVTFTEDKEATNYFLPFYQEMNEKHMQKMQHEEAVFEARKQKTIERNKNLSE